MNDVRNLLKEALGDSRPSPDALDQTKRRVRRREVNRRIAAGTLAMAVFAVAAVYAWTAFSMGGARGPASTPTPPATIEPPVANGAIYYRVAAADGTGRIDAVEPDGSGQHVAFPASSLPSRGQIAWTADGRQIAFDAYFGNHEGISTADADGSAVMSITSAPNDIWPSWSPEGRMIVFASTRYDPGIEACPTGIDLRCPTDIYVMNADGSDITRLTTDPASEWNPVWSPDGTQIAFVKGDSEVGVFVMGADGSGVQQVTATKGGSGFAPSWSPDGTEIVFGSIQYEDSGIFVVNADGTNERPLLFDNSIYATNPEWSPDGSLIAFTGSVGSADHTGLYVIRPDGSALTRIASGATGGFNGGVAWMTSTDECALPALRPTTLPWLQPGELVPPPEEERHYNRLNWFAPEGTEWEGGYVSLRLLASEDVTTGDPAPPLPDGTPGFEVKNGEEWDLFYAESSTYCGAIAMYVNVPGLSAEDSRSAAEKIANSLAAET